MVLATLCSEVLYNHWFLHHVRKQGAKTIGFTTFPTLNVAELIGFTTCPKVRLPNLLTLQHSKNIMLLKSSVLQHFQNKQLLKHLSADIFKIDVAKINRVSNNVFGSVATPIVLATFFSKMLYNQLF